MTGLLVALAHELVVVKVLHARLDLDLALHLLHLHRLTVEADHLPLVGDLLDASVVELLESRRHHDLDRGHRRQLGLVDAAKRRAEEAAFKLHAVAVVHVADVVERIVLEEVPVEDLVAVALVLVATGPLASCLIKNAQF